ncbi:MAG: hypothetical protein LC808_23250 [Actinobacteria bacterium]|nr:hypothetical protein [Actinomycetota bacterium]
MNQRQKVFAEVIRGFILTTAGDDPVHISRLYDVVESGRPDLIDGARRNPPHERTLKWHHDLQWSMKNLVLETSPQVIRRPEVGRGWYSAT